MLMDNKRPEELVRVVAEIKMLATITQINLFLSYTQSSKQFGWE
jgi:hypothetical protein